MSVANRDGANIPAPSILILGTQRSGTTLLTRVLSGHSKVFIQNEISVEKVFVKSGINEIVKRMGEQIEFRHGCSIVDLLAKQNKQIWGVKDPEFTDHLLALEDFIGASKFILIIRDGRGVVNSYIDNKWGLGTNAFTGAERWARETRAQLALMNKYPESFLLVRYEDLVSETEATMRKVCKHLELEYEPEMLDYNQHKASFVLNKSNANTSKRPDASFTEKWRRVLSNHQISVIEEVAGTELKTFDYVLVGQPVRLNPIVVCYYKLHQAVVGELQIQFQLKRFAFKQWLKKRRGHNA